ncbi:MAG: hypothetical protein GY822_23255 [Deltaproteobacteria bacterium]|nr:hypothetical protein [Deltaproteobacteria bacterium]
MGLLGNIGSAVTGVSMGDFAQKALQFVGVPKSFAAGVGALVDLKRGNLVGALQNGLEALTGTENLGEGLKRLQGKKCASAHSCSRPSSVLGTIAKVAGFATLGLGGAAMVGGVGMFAKGASISSGLGKMMAGIAAGVFMMKGLGGGGVVGGGVKSMMSGGLPGYTMSGNAALHKMKRGVGYSNIDSEIAKLPPNATFEQLVHAFMKGATKDQEEDVKVLMDKMKKQDTGSDSGGTQGGKQRSFFGGHLGGGSNFLSNLLGGAFGGGGINFLSNLFGGAFGGGGSVIGGAGKTAAGAATGEGTKGEESRALQMEELKFKMQNLTQMMQALSNIGNTMHAGSMNAIRNIRA